jgi:hypothetical protein
MENLCFKKHFVCNNRIGFKDALFKKIIFIKKSYIYKVEKIFLC